MSEKTEQQIERERGAVLAGARMNSTSQSYNNRAAGEPRHGNWMQTYTGVQFWPLDPRADEIKIVDIAHALSNMCRYAGHCCDFYSVAEHSILVSYLVPREDALAGLLHDATEAYLVDVPRPIKGYLGGYHEFEHRLWLSVAEAFDLAVELPESVKIADNAILLAEAEQIMGPKPAPWNVPGVAADVKIECLPPREAKDRFLARFCQLIDARKGER